VIETKSTSRKRSALSKVAFFVFAALFTIAAPLQFLNSTVLADKYDDQINAIQQQVDAFQTEANKLQQQASSLKKKIAALSAEKSAIQAQLKLSKARYDKLKADIKANKIKLANNKSAMGKIVADLYVDGGITPLEMLASSNNISEYMDQSELRISVAERLGTVVASIKELESKLEKDQKNVKKVLAQQKAQNESLIAKEAEKQSLLTQTKGKEASYQKKIANSKAKMSEIAAEQQAYLDRITGGGRYNAGSVGSFQFRNYSGNSACGGGGYPLCGAQDSYVDSWGLYNRECVSYTAWAAYTRFGKYVTNFSGQGNAMDWPYSAPNLMGAIADNTPEVGAVAILPATSGFAPIGHAMMVESIQGGGWVHVSQYNFGGTGMYSTMDIAASGVIFVHFNDR
jgi:peptidoglycan DL-endopeptidase CwlO